MLFSKFVLERSKMAMLYKHKLCKISSSWDYMNGNRLLCANRGLVGHFLMQFKLEVFYHNQPA